MINDENLKSISLPDENWAEIFEGMYAISTQGRLVSFFFKGKYRLRLLAQNNYAGYLHAHIHYGTSDKVVLVQQLVASAFIPNPRNLPKVNHKDGNKFNNRVENLEWVTKSQNKRHSIDVLKRPHPALGKSFENSNFHKEIEQYTTDMQLLNTFYSIQVASRDTGINESNISRCANGKRKTAGGYIWKFK